MADKDKLAINGGEKAVGQLKARFHFGVEEKEAAMRLFDRSIETLLKKGYRIKETESVRVNDPRSNTPKQR